MRSLSFVLPRPLSCSARNLLVSWGIALLASGSVFAAETEGRCRAVPSDPCIETPSEYRDSWNDYRVACVDSALYGTVPWNYPPTPGGGGGDTHLYPEEFAFAWAGGSTNLEKYLELRCRYRDDPIKSRVGIGSYIGFPIPLVNRDRNSADTPIAGFVYTLEALVPDSPPLAEAFPGARVPSFETWFHVLEQAFGLVFDLESQKDVVLAYSSLPVYDPARIRDQVDAVAVFTELTGCQKSRRWKRNPGFPPTADLRGCDENYLRAREAAGGAKVEPGGPTTRECFESFAVNYTGPRDATAFRAILELCQDANALNTGVGLGYNPMPNPFVCKRWRDQTVAEKYTGREYIVPNGRLDPAGQGDTWEVVTLEAVEDARYNLRRGYCR